MKPIKKIFLSVLVLVLVINASIFLCSVAGSYQATVEDISGSKYLPTAIEALKNAKSSIDMAMYFVNFDPWVKKSPVNELVEELINAHNRGVKVKVILDQNIEN